MGVFLKPDTGVFLKFIYLIYKKAKSHKLILYGSCNTRLVYLKTNA